MTKQEVKEKFMELVNSFEETANCKLSEDYKHVVNVDFNVYLNLIENLNENKARKLTEHGCEYAESVIKSYKDNPLYEIGVRSKLFGKKKGELVELFPNKIDLARKIIAFRNPEYDTSNHNQVRNEKGEPVKAEIIWWRDVQLQKHNLAWKFFSKERNEEKSGNLSEVELREYVERRWEELINEGYSQNKAAKKIEEETNKQRSFSTYKKWMNPKYY